MSYKQKPITPIIRLEAAGAELLTKAIKKPSSIKQKKAIKRSVGIFAFYRERWKKSPTA